MKTHHTPREVLETQTHTASVCCAYTVTEQVVLAGQPQPDDWQKLKEQGFHTVINIRSDAERAAIQALSAEAAGLRYIYLPVPAYELEADDLATFAEVVSLPENGKMFIHCRSGTRVALLWMLYRIVHQRWSLEQARAELRAAQYDDDAMETFDFCTEDFFERTHLVGHSSQQTEA